MFVKYYYIFLLIVFLFKNVNSFVLPLYLTPQDWFPSELAVGDFFSVVSSNYNPYISIYLGTPPQRVNVSFSFNSAKTWITNSYFTDNKLGENFNPQTSSSYEKDESKQITFSYKLNFLTNYLSFDIMSPIYDTSLMKTIQAKYQFSIQSQTQTTIDEKFFSLGGQIGLKYPQPSEEAIMEPSTNPAYSFDNFFWLNNLKTNKLIDRRSIGFRFNSTNGVAFIGERLNLTISNISCASNTSLKIPLKEISINDNTIKVPFSQVNVEFSLEQNYIFAYGNEAQTLFNIITSKLNSSCTVENTAYSYRGIICDKSKKMEIFANLTDIKFKFTEGNNSAISFSPSDLFKIKDDLMVFKIVFQFTKFNKPWVFGTMFFESNIIVFDYDLATISIGNILPGNDVPSNPIHPIGPPHQDDKPSTEDNESKPTIIPSDDVNNNNFNVKKKKRYFGGAITVNILGCVFIVLFKYNQYKTKITFENNSMFE